LALLGDTNRTPAATIKLTAVALTAGLQERVAWLPCVVTSDGAHIVPPRRWSASGLMVVTSPLADALGLGIRLADDHLADDEAARAVMAWLREVGATLHAGTHEEVLRRLALVGRVGNCLDEPLTDDQLRALREAFESLPGPERTSLGYEVGRAIQIAAYRYDARGRRVETSARPAELYLSQAIDRAQDSFAVAAHKTQGLLWCADRYATQLRSSRGRTEGVGPQKFLGMLGVERAPRLVPHSRLVERYASSPHKGLPVVTPGSERTRKLQELGATYTLSDLDSPDLRAVAFNIAEDRKATRRRQRASALLGTLGRAWNYLEDEAEVAAVYDYNGWNHRGRVKAFWLWSVGSIAWLDDTTGKPRQPLILRLKTPSTVAVHGPDAPGYLRPEFDAPNRREILAALGVAGEPSTGDLVDRLRRLRDNPGASEAVATDAAIIYQGLADRLSSQISVRGDLSELELRRAFAHGPGLVHTDLGWCPPAEVLAGPPIFGQYHAFVPQVPRTDRLWRTLRLRQPSLDDCVRVIRRVAKNGIALEGGDRIVVLETLRMLADRIKTEPDITRGVKRGLASLPVFTSQGWTNGRPVYTTDDAAILDGLGSTVPGWDPGGDVSQFEALLGPLRITRLGSDPAVIDPDAAELDDDATELLTQAVSLLQDDVACNDPDAARALTVEWDRLREFEVRVNPNLQVRVDLLDGRPPRQIDVSATADLRSGVLFLRDSSLLRKVDVGGRAVASLFAITSRRQLAHAWLAACAAADDGRTAQRLELAEQRAAADHERLEREVAERTESFRQEIAAKHQGKARGRGAQDGGPGAGNASGSAPAPDNRDTKPRVLVDPSMLVVVNAEGHPVGATRTTKAAKRNKKTGLVEPDRNATPPRNIKAPPTFTPQDKESVGMTLAKLVLESDDNKIIDLRNQRGVGADAVDSLERFFDLKAHLGDEPDSIHLEPSQIERALTTPGYFVVVVSNIEGVDARPQVRVIPDPVHQLTTAESSSVTFTGVRSAKHTLVYPLGPAGDEKDSE
jgi:hypothetical protein